MTAEPGIDQSGNSRGEIGADYYHYIYPPFTVAVHGRPDEIALLAQEYLYSNKHFGVVGQTKGLFDGVVLAPEADRINGRPYGYPTELVSIERTRELPKFLDRQRIRVKKVDLMKLGQGALFMRKPAKGNAPLEEAPTIYYLDERGKPLIIQRDFHAYQETAIIAPSRPT